MVRRFSFKTDKINSANYLTMVALEDGLQAKLDGNDCEYCIDGNGIWKTLPNGDLTEPINTRHSISFRANLTPKSTIGVGTFMVNKYYNLKGNCMSLLYGDNANENISLKHYAFRNLFLGNDRLVNAKDFILPAKTVFGERCYDSLFKNCTSLITAPELPATKFASAHHAYESMFYGCISLKDAPKLPAITFSNLAYIYQSMFYGCTSLMTAPILPAMVATQGCYQSMFNGCISLTTAPELPALTVEHSCYKEMFRGCKSLIKAPILPAKTLNTVCYREMFRDCNNLSHIKMLATDVGESKIESLAYWTYGVALSGTFVKASGLEIPTGTSGIPDGWTVMEE